MMMNWLHYLLEANLYLAVAYGCYWLMFRKQTFYTANRVYLLASTVLCFVIPLVQVGKPEPPKVATPVAQTTSVILYDAPPGITPTPEDPFFTLNKAPETIYWLVAAMMCVWLLVKLYSLLKLVIHSKRKVSGNYTLVYVNQNATPFSFFGYLFVNESEQLAEALLRHELVHIRQKHSWDIMFMEVLKVINWFNPVVYLLQNSLKALHEFEADRCAVTDRVNQDNYVDFLIARAYHSNGLPFAHHFSNKQLLKSRIMKLYQKRSGKLARLNYLMALPLCAGLLCASSLAFSKDYGWIKIGLKHAKFNELPVDSTAQKLRLKVTSNGMTGVTDKLEIKGYPGKKMIYTAQTLTAIDRKYLLQNFGIVIETTTASATTTSLVFPSPPPPPIKPSERKSHDIPPPPPPSALRSSKTIGIAPFPPPIVHFAAPKKPSKPLKAAPIKFLPPRVYDEAGKEVKAISQNRSAINPDTVKQVSGNQIKPSLNINKFRGLTEHIASYFEYPAAAIAHKTAGYSMIGFKINNDRKLSTVFMVESLSPETDKELVKCILSYKGTINATPGNYTMGFILAIEGLVLRDSAGQIKSLGGVNLGTKKRTGREPKPNTLTMMLRGKEVEMKTSKTKERPLIEVKSAKKSFIELETIRFKNIANFTKPVSAGC